MGRPRRKARARGRPLPWEPLWASDLDEGAWPKTRLGAADSILCTVLPTRLPHPLLCLIESFAGPPPITPRGVLSETSWQKLETMSIPRALRLTCGKHKRMLLATAHLQGAQPPSRAQGDDWELEAVTYCGHMHHPSDGDLSPDTKEEEQMFWDSGCD